MGLQQNRATHSLGSIGTTQVINIAGETAYTLGSGYVAIEVTNVGDSAVWYGSTGVTANSGGYLAVHGSKFWDDVVDNFTLYFISAASSSVAIHEYEGR